MANFYSDNDDLRFYIDQYIDWEKLVDLVELHYKATDAPKDWREAVDGYRSVLELVGQFVADEVAPRGRALDREGVHMVDGVVRGGPAHEAIFRQLKEMGMYGLTVPRELGGMNFPVTIYFLIAELFARGDVATMTHFAFHPATTMALVEYSLMEGSAKVDCDGRVLATRWDDVIQQIMAGETWGSMDLTEADAGSDLAAIRTKAVKDDRGVWRVTGNKIFITSGHGNYHLVLAKTAERASLGALSLFLVPLQLERDGERVRNAWVDRVEEKIGHHGSATCSVQYEDSEAQLIGKEGEGFKLMLMLMNNARVGVGFESIGICEAAYRLARDYAAERRSMGKTIDRHELIADYLDEMATTIQGLRALAVEGAVFEEMSNRMTHLQRAQGNGKEMDGGAKRYKRRARSITPLLKYLAAESAVQLTRMSMQIHGGNGYMKDYDPERLLRDALVLPVYEGTSQIQALMAFKDHMMDAIKAPQRFLQRMARAKLDAVRSRDGLERSLHSMRSLAYSAQQHILIKIAKDKWTVAMAGPLPRFLDTFLKGWDPKRDFSFGLLHAERLARILADVEVTRVLVKQARRFPERRELAERWIERAEPRVRYNWDMIMHSGDRMVEGLRQRRVKEPARADAPVRA